MRPSRERLDEIRASACSLNITSEGLFLEGPFQMISDLLAEIDALEAESAFRNECAKDYAEKCGILQAEWDYCRKERDRLKERVAKLKHILSLYVLGDENGALDDAGELGRKTIYADDEMEKLSS